MRGGLVTPLVQNSNLLLEDLRRLNQLKDSLYENNLKNKTKTNTQRFRR